MKYLILLIALLSACQSEPPTTTTTPAVKQAPVAAQVSAAAKTTCQDCATCAGCAAAKSPDYFYSPFVVSLAGSHHFKQVSFKDVGLKRTEPGPNDPLLEVIAESLAFHLSESQLNVQAQVSYDESILDPSNHVACGGDHLYVDIWRSGDDRLGYSLWSGCGDNDNFAWKEVPATFEPSDLASVVEPLAASITESLARATKNSCFQKSC